MLGVLVTIRDVGVAAVTAVGIDGLVRTGGVASASSAVENVLSTFRWRVDIGRSIFPLD
jgi:hypothetical protein